MGNQYSIISVSYSLLILHSSFFVPKSLSFPEKIKAFVYFFFPCSLVDADIAHIAQQGKIYFVRFVLLVVCHQFKQRLIIVATEV